MKDQLEISANYFFHFTNKIDNIVNILLEGFKPFYCLEKLNYIDVKSKNNSSYFDMAFPIVSFCDLPYHLQSSHRIKYGGYGIALDKKWGIDNHLTPVVYTNTKAYTSGVLKNLFGLTLKMKLENEDLIAYKNNISFLLMCFKPYEGYQYNKEEKKFDNEISRFYDEKEWRYLPLNCDGLKLYLEKHEFENQSVLMHENKRIQKNNHLYFSLNDLHHIFLTNNSEIEILLQNLSSKYKSFELSIIKEKIKISQ